MTATPPRKDRRFGGFTRAELLAVILIIGFLIALIVPGVQVAREAARRSQCNGNLKQIGLGLQTYADVNKTFPPDALWGRCPKDEAGDTAATRQLAHHYPWSVAILPFVTSVPLYNALNKRGAIWNQSQQYGTGDAPKVNPPAYFGYVQSQKILNRCPSDLTFTGPSDLPGLCSWTNYAGSVGVGFYSAELKKGSVCEGETTAPDQTRGIFAFNEPANFRSIQDGISNTIAVAEVTSCSVAAPNTAGARSYNGALSADLFFPADADQPMPPKWNLPGSNAAAWSPGALLAGGTGKSGANLFTTPGGPSRVPMVFRSAMIALTESVTGSGPCSLPDTYSSAQGGDCGQGGGANAIAGFELAGKVGQTPIVGIAPLYNALYSPQSNWPGADGNHPGIVLVVFGDGHTSAIQNRIDFPTWASLNTRQGGEAIDGDF